MKRFIFTSNHANLSKNATTMLKTELLCRFYTLIVLFLRKVKYLCLLLE